MGLAEFVKPPAGVASTPFGQALCESLDSVPTKLRGHGCASPERRDNQSDVLVRQSDSSVCHEAYGTIAPQARVKTSWAVCYHLLERWPA